MKPAASPCASLRKLACFGTGTTIFLTTHYIEEAERLCHRIAFIVSGRIACIDTVKNLMRQTDNHHVVQFGVSDRAADLSAAIAAEFANLKCQAVNEGGIRIESSQPVRVGPLVRFMEDRGAEVSEALKVRPSLEDVFVRITGIEVTTMKQEKEKGKGGGGS